jgi:ectoine hydroxylase-related dioxygenase (phytanoyl-CoA dioxygenase family)
MSDIRVIFQSEQAEAFFRQNGYFVFDLLDQAGCQAIWSFYERSFKQERPLIPQAEKLPYYISIFDRDTEHKRQADALISGYVQPAIRGLLADYDVFYSNFMIKFPGDGQIEAHQDFNFVDESRHTAFNLWCPLVDAGPDNGGLFVIPGSHRVFRTQRGPNIPRALTQYNQLLKKYARLIPLRKGQAIIFDHKLIHYSTPNFSQTARVAIQSVLKPAETPALHYFFDRESGKVKACRIDRDFIFENNLWENDPGALPLDHEQELIPFPSEEEMTDQLVRLKIEDARVSILNARPVLNDGNLQVTFQERGFVKIPLLDDNDVSRLNQIFHNYTGGKVENTEYGIYISLEEEDQDVKKKLVEQIAALVLPKAERYFNACKPHLGSFLVKMPGENSYTYPHQDWTFVDAPPYCSMTIWIALTDTDRSNGNLGFIRGSHLFFDKPVGSPSPEFLTLTQGHEHILYEYLEFVPLRAGEAVIFDNRTIHGATANRSAAPRTAVAIGMTPEEAPLFHYYLVPAQETPAGYRKIAKLKVDQGFFHRHSVRHMQKLYAERRLPEDNAEKTIITEEFIPFSCEEIRKLCEQAGLVRNGECLRGQELPEPETWWGRLLSRFKRSL